MKVINGIECEECLKPELVRFETGDCLEGVLLQRNRVTLAGRPAIQYLLEKPNGLVVKFNGTADIIEKLRADDVGHFVSIACIGEDTTVRRGENCMKVFEIYRSKAPVGKVRADSAGNVKVEPPARDNPEITDEDIPF